MPETSVSSTNPPQVDADVDNGGGGPPTHVVGVYMTWDPAYLVGSNPRYPANAYLDQAHGFCVWWNKAIGAGNSMKFWLRLRRIADGPAWVLACSFDPRSESWSDPVSWEVPANHPRLEVSTKKTKKKAKKKKAKKKTAKKE
jgi:hypothetical protein